MLDLILSLVFALISGGLALWLVSSELTLTAAKQAAEEKVSETAEKESPEAAEPSAPAEPESLLEIRMESEENSRGALRGFSPPLIVLLFLCGVAIALFRLYYYHSPVLETVSLLFLLAILWASALTDYRWFRIPNRFLLIGLVLRCVLFAVIALTNPGQIKFVLLRCGIAAAALLLVSLLCRLALPKSVGFGDIKLLALMGLYLGLDGIWGAVFFTMLASFLVSLTLLIAKKVTRKTEIPFAPFLLVGTILSSFLTYF